MAGQQTIVVWDLCVERIRVMEANLRMAMRALGIRALVQFNSEEPLLSRHNLIGRTPAVQVNGGGLWHCAVGETISKEAFISLFTHLRELQLLEF